MMERINQTAMQRHQSDMLKRKILDGLGNEQMTSKQITAKLGIEWDKFKHLLDGLRDSQHIIKSRYYCEVNRRSYSAFVTTGKEFVPRTYEECLAGLSSRLQQLSKKGKYDDLMASNPNRRVYAGKKSLFDTKPNAYFGKGQMTATYKGINSTFSMMDGASGFD